jgi:hypothetical protein
MANAFESAINALVEAGEPLSAVLREFGEALGSHDLEARQMIYEIADVYSELEPQLGSFSDGDEDEGTE